MTRRRSGYVQVDIQDILNEVDDDYLLDELASRKLTGASLGETCDLNIVREAYEAMGRNRHAEAKVILERLLFPKWRTARKCAEQYEQLKLSQ